MDADFTWSPVIGKDGTSFTIRPAKGINNRIYLPITT